MTLCNANRYNPYGYLDLNILTEYAEYANSLCEFVLNTIVIDYVVRISIRNNNKNLLNNTQLTNSTCISLYNINLDTDFIPYGEKMRRICAMSKSTFYDMKTTRLIHPSWIVRFSPNYRRVLRVFACNLRHLVKKIGTIEGYVTKADLNGEILRYHAVSAALTTVKYDLVTLYVTIRSGSLMAMKTSFLYPILSDTQRWLAYSYYQIKMILASFPGSSVNRHSNKKVSNIQIKNDIQSLNIINKKLEKSIEQSETSSNKNKTEQLTINQNL
ncbi:unnamed protein product [Rotaria sordida]|uniref:Uncharacterized protein n=1 Tax=Rotaria sordida TaxID=392033 RepID=A0A818L3T1_9BILA|nr:unnamed protein product [Rotaria sordida]CAF0786757.1 unnamed protein product [Rotaria sordida]CAF0806728.1 unnamed protein product [Rotaria sordida]CAF0815108.1 unnamed protein product [Rotaria sordida]CAF3489498.1 unnamed protein product [Rotaria sordida]